MKKNYFVVWIMPGGPRDLAIRNLWAPKNNTFFAFGAPNSWGGERAKNEKWLFCVLKNTGRPFAALWEPTKFIRRSTDTRSFPTLPRKSLHFPFKIWAKSRKLKIRNFPSKTHPGGEAAFSSIFTHFAAPKKPSTREKNPRRPSKTPKLKNPRNLAINFF